jgi:hypothetical protein
MNRDELQASLRRFRKSLELAFSSDTAAPGASGVTPSAGQCAAVAAILCEHVGGALVSAKVEGQSHWFNRLQIDDVILDVDITGDQFGRAPIQIGNPGDLYEGTRERSPEELNSETRQRAALLAERAGIVRGAPSRPKD